MGVAKMSMDNSFCYDIIFKERERCNGELHNLAHLPNPRNDFIFRAR